MDDAAVNDAALRGARKDLKARLDLTRNDAVELLGDHGSRADGYRLARMAVRDPSMIVRHSAVTALWRHGDRFFDVIVDRLFNDPEELIRRDAAFELLDLKTSLDRLTPLKQALDTEVNDLAKVGILTALILLGHQENLLQLIQLLNSRRFLVVATVFRSLLEDGVLSLLSDDQRSQVRQKIVRLRRKAVMPSWVMKKADEVEAKLLVAGVINAAY